MNKVRIQQAGALGLLTLSNPPLNLFDEELMADLRAAVDQARRLPLRALLVRADGKHFSAAPTLRSSETRLPMKRGSASPVICEPSPISKNCRFPPSRQCGGPAWPRVSNSHWHATLSGPLLQPALARSKRRLGPPPCWAASNVWQSGPGLVGRERSSTPPTSMTPRPSNAGTS